MLSAHSHANLEYWFFKVNAGSMALIVDWIARRRQNELWLRASVHSAHGREVLLEKLTQPVGAGPTGLTTTGTTGNIGAISWELKISTGNEWISPDVFPARALRMTDLILVSAPLATFTGQISHGPETAALRDSPGLLSHYWGRGLAPEWWWVSANQFNLPGVAVECSVSRSGLWGLPAGLPLAYLYLCDPGGGRLLMSPPASVRVVGSPEEFTITFKARGRQSITLKAQGRDYGDFGDRIINTLVGDLEIREGSTLIAHSRGTAALERRLPP